jgi:hypothetical protein
LSSGSSVLFCLLLFLALLQTPCATTAFAFPASFVRRLERAHCAAFHIWSVRCDIADVLDRCVALQQLRGVLRLAFGFLSSQKVSLLLFLVVCLTSFGECFSALSLLVLDSLLAPPLSLHVFLALLLFSDLLTLDLLPCLTFMLLVV